MVKLYTTPTCFYCEALKNFFNEHNIKYETIDVSKDHEALHEMMEKTGQMGVPVIDIDGEIIVGFDREKIVSLLKIKE